MALVMTPPDASAGQIVTQGGVLVLDTNIVLDLLVFGDPVARALRQALDGGTVQWLATPAMRDELERVLAYSHILARLLAPSTTHVRVLAQFDQFSRTVAVPPGAAIRCSDSDDQMFIDLAVAHRASLLSKDRAVLSLHRRLAGVGVRASPALEAPITSLVPAAMGTRRPQTSYKP